ncbi:MAG TPA: ABC transporter permease [Candidatus Copromorpha excrementipullorum]|uniref:ABC transporter permease n=1 Tax=Candidatus Allocopromorpha excrementipullorum TaxID=2840743 RepID=A0A9D1N883_9FIRM|nr:ABC transporter permease [Candidatus Copromorpha excrementipullorum]
MKAIFKKELRSFFLSMTGYAMIAFLITFVGIYFMIYNIGYGYPYFAYTLSGVMLILLVLVPVITMRSFAEEKKNRTDQLLFTSPIKIRDIVLGKYAAMVSVFFVPNVVFCLFPLIIKTMGNSSLLSDYVSLMEFFLMGCAFIAIGMFFSSVTESPMIAAVITFAVTLILYIWDTLIGYLPSSAFANLAVLIVIVICGALLLHHVNKNKYLSIGLAAVATVALTVVYIVDSSLFENRLNLILSKLDVAAAFNNAAFNSLFDLPGTIVNLTIIGVFIFLTVQSIEKRRWS